MQSQDDLNTHTDFNFRGLTIKAQRSDTTASGCTVSTNGSSIASSRMTVMSKPYTLRQTAKQERR